MQPCMSIARGSWRALAVLAATSVSASVHASAPRASVRHISQCRTAQRTQRTDLRDTGWKPKRAAESKTGSSRRLSYHDATPPTTRRYIAVVPHAPPFYHTHRSRLSSKQPSSSSSSVASYSTSFARSATHAVFNPQKDDQGNDLLLEITPRAAKRLTEIMSRDSNPNLALRIQVESGGCHGFQYLISLVTLPETLSPLSSPEQFASINEDDTVFAFSPENGRLPGGSLASVPKIVLDGPSLNLLKGSKVDFTMELIGSQFKIVDNPLATSSCGCGTSFDIKM